jgi:hypothetical protein
LEDRSVKSNVKETGAVDIALTLDPGVLDRLDQSARGAITSAIADAQRAVKRILKRAEEMPAEWERVEFVQDRGPTIEATARLIAETSFDTRQGQPLQMDLEIWETQGGALIAVSASTLPGGTGREDLRATVIPPIADVQAMRFAVMDALNWHVRARSMVRKLGWSLRVEID